MFVLLSIVTVTAAFAAAGTARAATPAVMASAATRPREMVLRGCTTTKTLPHPGMFPRGKDRGVSTVRVRVRSGTIVAMSAVYSPLPQTLDPERLSDHADRLMRIARRLTGSREGAEDLVQDTFERVLRKPRSLAGDEIAYLVGALRNTHIARLRAASRRIQPEAVPEGFDLPDRRHDDTVTALHAREILSAVADLPEQYRAAVVAVDLQGQSYDEAAMRLGMPRGTVQSRAFRGRARVARAVGDTNLSSDRIPVF